MYMQNNREHMEVFKLSQALLSSQRLLEAADLEVHSLREEKDEWLARAHQLERSVTQLSDALSSRLARNWWDEQRPIGWRRFLVSRWPRLGRWLGVPDDSRVNPEHVRLLEASSLFQAGWYLRDNLDVAMAGISPAVHYLESGALENRNPGPEFDTRKYMAEHPELCQEGINPLVHFLQGE